MSWVSLIPRKLRRAGFLASQDDETPCLLIGENGSGKGGFARWIHEHGPRVGRPVVILNRDTAWEPQILDAGSGSVVFPELESMNEFELQILERCLRNKTVERDSMESGLRLYSLVPARVFVTSLETPRADWPLYPLFKDHVLRIPPVRERRAEFEDLAVTLLHELAHSLQKNHIKGFSPDALARLKNHTWPGNLRELRNALYFAILGASSDLIALDDLPEFGKTWLDLSASRLSFETTFVPIQSDASSHGSVAVQPLRQEPRTPSADLDSSQT